MYDESLFNNEIAALNLPSEVSYGLTNQKSISAYEPQPEISKNVVCGTNKDSDQLAHMHSQIWAFASQLSILCLLSHWQTSFGVSKLKRRLHRLTWIYTCQNTTLLEITCHGSIMCLLGHILELLVNAGLLLGYNTIVFSYRCLPTV